MYDRKLRNGDVASACQCHQDGDPIARPLGPMTGGFLLGSDTLGRDLAAGIAHGGERHRGI